MQETVTQTVCCSILWIVRFFIENYNTRVIVCHGKLPKQYLLMGKRISAVLLNPGSIRGEHRRHTPDSGHYVGTSMWSRIRQHLGESILATCPNVLQPVLGANTVAEVRIAQILGDTFGASTFRKSGHAGQSTVSVLGSWRFSETGRLQHAASLRVKTPGSC